MAIPWIAVGKAVYSAWQAYQSYLNRGQAAAERERDRDMILTAIRNVGDQILDRLDLLEIDDLKGELEGFQDIYESYDPKPGDSVEEDRLVRLIDDSARVLGRLGADLDSVGSDPDLAFQAWAIYVPLLYLRAQAMAERQITYGADETRDALQSFDMALPRLSRLLSILRAKSDAKFGPVVCRPTPDSQDSRVCWYMYQHSQFICGSLSDPTGFRKCEQSRATHMDGAYSAFDGVQQISAALTQLQDARDNLDAIGTLDILATHGVDVGEIVFVDGRLTRSLPKPRTSARKVRRAPDQDWFT
jgi:hypothetical protein